MPDLFQAFAFDDDGPTVDYVIYCQAGPFWYYQARFSTEGEAREYLAQYSGDYPFCIRKVTAEIIARTHREEK